MPIMYEFSSLQTKEIHLQNRASRTFLIHRLLSIDTHKAKPPIGYGLLHTKTINKKGAG